MSGMIGNLRDIYVRLMVWLGAAPPEGYEHLIPDETPPKEYTVKEGETIFAVARKFGVHYELIAKANDIEDYNSVQAGQTLIIPSPDWKPEPGPEPESPVETAPADEIGAPPEAQELEWPAAAEAISEPEPEAKIEPPAEAKMATPAEDVGAIVAGEALEDTGAGPEAEPTAAVQEPLPEFEAEATPEPPEMTKPEVAAPTDSDMEFRYEVQRGDTVSAVARRYGLTVKELVEANDIADPSRIFPGQKLIIPGYMSPRPEPEAAAEPAPPRVQADEHFVYTLAGGDTLSSVAKRYGITLRELIEANNIEDPNLIRVGQKLIIPGVLRSTEPLPAHQQDFESASLVADDADFVPVGATSAVRAMYVSYFAVGHTDVRKRIFDLLDTTEFNAVVVDAKGDFGWISYPSQIPLAHDIGAARPTAADFSQLLTQFKERGVYTIARIVTFKDNPLAASRPELAVKTKDGAIWRDRDELAWADPYLKPVWDYNVQIALEAAQLGFDEIQFDFIRFPTPSPAGIPYFSQEVTKDTRVAAITGFLSTARGQLQPLGLKMAADTFGYTCWRTDDTVIGQDIDRMGQYLDVLCPMLYPSTFGNGIPGYKFAIAYPYEIVYHSAARAVNRLQPLGCTVRPWIQDFPDYRFDKRVYGRAEIQAQIKGCFDSGSSGFMVWDPKVRYTDGAYAPARELA